MKNFILLLGMMLFAGMAMGQMKIISTGQAIVGDNSGVTPAAGAAMTVNQGAVDVINTNASASAAFIRTDASALTFGAGARAGFKADEDFHFEFRSGERSTVVGRQVSTGNLLMRFEANTGDVGIGIGNPTEKLHVSGNIFASGMITPSDIRLKNLMKSDDIPGLDAVLGMNVVRYQYNGKSGISSTEPHIGVVAQEFQKLVPAMVGEYTYSDEDADGNVTREETFLNIRDNEIKYLLVNAIQDQQEIIEDLQAQIEELRESVAVNNDASNSNSVDLIDVAQSTLGQNSPNPYNEGTVISYSVADNATSAKMNFYNLTGQLIKSVSLQNGAGKVNVSADELPSGTYTYSLEVDGALISNKKMVKMR